MLTKYLVSAIADWKLGKWEENMPMRAKQLRVITEGLGPAYIKIAQVRQ